MSLLNSTSKKDVKLDLKGSALPDDMLDQVAGGTGIIIQCPQSDLADNSNLGMPISGKPQ